MPLTHDILLFKRAKLPQTVDTEKAITTPPIIMITPPPIDAKKWDKSCLEIFNDTSPRTNTLAKAYGDRVKAVAKEMDCLIVDAFLLLGGDRKDGESHYGLHLEDGLHLNEQGSKLLYDVSIHYHCLCIYILFAHPPAFLFRV